MLLIQEIWCLPSRWKCLGSGGHRNHTDTLSLKPQSSQGLSEKPLEFLTLSVNLPPRFSVYISEKSCPQELAASLYIIPHAWTATATES